MTDPIQIMGEIERRYENEGSGVVYVQRPKWQSLRTALEAQAEELAQNDARIARLEGVASGLVRQAEEWGWRLHSDMRGYWCGRCRKALNESPAQSAAAIKAEVLRDEARQWREAGEFHVEHHPRKEGDRELVHFFIADQLQSKAGRIEREAKEGSEKRPRTTPDMTCMGIVDERDRREGGE